MPNELSIDERRAACARFMQAIGKQTGPPYWYRPDADTRTGRKQAEQLFQFLLEKGYEIESISEKDLSSLCINIAESGENVADGQDKTISSALVSAVALLQVEVEKNAQANPAAAD